MKTFFIVVSFLFINSLLSYDFEIEILSVGDERDTNIFKYGCSTSVIQPLHPDRTTQKHWARVLEWSLVADWTHDATIKFCGIGATRTFKSRRRK